MANYGLALPAHLGGLGGGYNYGGSLPAHLGAAGDLDLNALLGKVISAAPAVVGALNPAAPAGPTTVSYTTVAAPPVTQTGLQQQANKNNTIAYIAIGVAALLGVGLIVMMMSRRSREARQNPKRKGRVRRRRARRSK